MKKLSLLVLLLVISFTSCASPAYLYETQSGNYKTLEEGVKSMDPQGFYVLGETHYVRDVQEVQGKFIEAFIKQHRLQNNFSVAWEFMDYPKQSDLESLFLNYS
ncbi:MAG: hypothetical protein NXH75_01835, partial [Halobacteriovoraceae bacterium]|nr:hypothetical protein [Halobacteriovoraceae bacterium]